MAALGFLGAADSDFRADERAVGSLYEPLTFTSFAEATNFLKLRLLVMTSDVFCLTQQLVFTRGSLVLLFRLFFP